MKEKLPVSCSARLVAITCSHTSRGNLIFYSSGNNAHLTSASESWLHCLTFGEAGINTENQWKQTILYLCFPYTSSDSLDQELQSSNPTLQPVALARLLTPTIILLYYKNSIPPPKQLYFLTTYKGRHEYHARMPAEGKGGQEEPGRVGGSMTNNIIRG